MMIANRQLLEWVMNPFIQSLENEAKTMSLSRSPSLSLYVNEPQGRIQDLIKGGGARS